MAPAPMAMVVAEEPVCASSAAPGAAGAAGAAPGSEGEALGRASEGADGRALGAALGDALGASEPALGGVLTEGRAWDRPRWATHWPAR